MRKYINFIYFSISPLTIFLNIKTLSTNRTNQIWSTQLFVYRIIDDLQKKLDKLGQYGEFDTIILQLNEYTSLKKVM